MTRMSFHRQGKCVTRCPFQGSHSFAYMYGLFPLSVGIVGSLVLIFISLVSLLKAQSSDFHLALFTFDFEASGHVFALWFTSGRI